MKRQEFVDEVNAKLDKWEAEIRRLEAKKDTVQAQAREEYLQQMKDLREKQNDARNRIRELREAGEEAWTDVKSGVEEAVDTMKESLQSAAAKLN